MGKPCLGIDQETQVYFMINPDLIGNGQGLHYGKRNTVYFLCLFLGELKTGLFYFLFFFFWFSVFIYWVVKNLFLINSYKIIFGLLILWQCTFEIQLSLIYLLKTQISFIKHILQSYYKFVMDFNLNFHGNKKLITNKKLIKKYYLFKYYKNNIFNNGILFLEKTHSTKESEVK